MDLKDYKEYCEANVEAYRVKRLGETVNDAYGIAHDGNGNVLGYTTYSDVSGSYFKSQVALCNLLIEKINSLTDNENLRTLASTYALGIINEGKDHQSFNQHWLIEAAGKDIIRFTLIRRPMIELQLDLDPEGVCSYEFFAYESAAKHPEWSWWEYKYRLQKAYFPGNSNCKPSIEEVVEDLELYLQYR